MAHDTALADARGASDRRERLDRRVLTDLDFDVDHGRARIDDAYPRRHVTRVDRLLRQPAHLRERRPVVDAEHESLVGDLVRRDRPAVGTNQIERLRQIQLALGIVGTQPRQCLPEGIARKHVDAGVHLAYPQLLGVASPAALVSTTRSTAPCSSRTTRP